MKRFIPIILAFVLVLSMFSCGKKDDTTNSDNTSSTIEKVTDSDGNIVTNKSDNSGTSESGTENGDKDTDETVSDISITDIKNNTKEVLENLTPDDKAMLVVEANQNGEKVSFTDDGSVIYTHSDGSSTVYHVDGTTEERKATTINVISSTEMPNNDFTQNIPMVNMAVKSYVEDETYCKINFSDATIDDVKVYAGLLKEAGYVANSSETDMEEAGIYSYAADNNFGLKISIVFSGDQTSLTIEKVS